jgi:hypothetical protein
VPPIKPDGDTTARLRKQTGGLFLSLGTLLLGSAPIPLPSFHVAEFLFGNLALTMISVWLEP